MRGRRAQLDRYMPAIVAGEKITAVAVTEPDAGSDVRSIRTTAKRDGDGWVINGSKMYITNGVHADLYFVAAKTDPSAVPRASPCSSSRKARPASRSRGRSKRWDGDLRTRLNLCSTTAACPMRTCLVRKGGPLGRTVDEEFPAMNASRSARWRWAKPRKALQITLDYVKQRKAFGAVLWDKQAIRQRLSMLAAKVEAGPPTCLFSRVGRCAGTRLRARSVDGQGLLRRDLVNEVIHDCLQFHGGAGYISDAAIERMARDARIQCHRWRCHRGDVGGSRQAPLRSQ